MLVALLALFVALGGPAQAKKLIDGTDLRKGSVRSAAIKDRSLTTKDLSAGTVRELQTTPNNTIGTSKLTGGAVTADKLAVAAVGPGALAGGAVGGGAIADGSVAAADIADGAVGAGKLAPGAVTGDKIADGTLTTSDIARFSGAFRIVAEDFATIAPHDCWSREPRGLAPEAAGADISQDALLVTPRSTLPARSLSFNYRTSAATPADPGGASRFVLTLCNRTDDPVTPGSIAFSYVVFDLP
jgi:hypothetical protein